eukprot:TRINITY_DN354_c0_g1_i1.p1 TRINITY_DN354_c0_g1~~TRINITY_DN354_c0_g1_i1.p1  ORF type:complete len:484 (+),score=43.88 TRINITY_DN354_c0_g1_i1:35-1486(+)
MNMAHDFCEDGLTHECTPDAGDTTWVLLSSILVLVMMPALAFFEAGLLNAKNTLSILSQILAGVAVLSVMWHIFGFGLVYGPSKGGIIGDFTHFVMYLHLDNNCYCKAPTVPSLAFVIFQLMFAAISPLLMTGCFAGRLRFRAYIVFIVLWEGIIYYPLAHWVWGGGFLGKLGVLDFAGGIVIHTSSGVSSLVIALVLGRRCDFDKYGGEIPPSSVPLASVGAALLWIGWYGFNAGSAFAANFLSATVVANTTIAAAISAVAWSMLSVYHTSHLNTVSVLNGAIAGLAGITPTSGYIETYWASVIGAILGVGSFYSVVLLKEKLKIDDALDVSSVHGVTGVIGSICIGFFASKAVNPGGHDGVIHGNPKQLAIQLLGVGVAAIWGGLCTFVIMRVMKFVGLQRISMEQELLGLDKLEHGEDPAYNYLREDSQPEAFHELEAQRHSSDDDTEHLVNPGNIQNNTHGNDHGGHGHLKKHTSSIWH